MRAYRKAALVLALSAAAACRERREAAGRAPAGVATPATTAWHCPLRLTDLRVDVDSLAGLPTRLSIGELRALCPGARPDTVGVGGTSPPALRFDAPGATVWAIQTAYEAYGDSLHPGEPADLWAASGDSLRFPDGALVPRRVGALRALDSAAVVVVDHGDDGTGSYVVRCKFPGVAVVIDNVWPPFADSGVVAFARAAPTDTTAVWRVEVEAGRVDSAAARACGGGPAT